MNLYFIIFDEHQARTGHNINTPHLSPMSGSCGVCHELQKEKRRIQDAINKDYEDKKDWRLKWLKRTFAVLIPCLYVAGAILFYEVGGSKLNYAIAILATAWYLDSIYFKRNRK